MSPQILIDFVQNFGLPVTITIVFFIFAIRALLKMQKANQESIEFFQRTLLKQLEKSEEKNQEYLNNLQLVMTSQISTLNGTISEQLVKVTLLLEKEMEMRGSLPTYINIPPFEGKTHEEAKHQIKEILSKIDLKKQNKINYHGEFNIIPEEDYLRIDLPEELDDNNNILFQALLNIFNDKSMKNIVLNCKKLVFMCPSAAKTILEFGRSGLVMVFINTSQNIRKTLQISDQLNELRIVDNLEQGIANFMNNNISITSESDEHTLVLEIRGKLLKNINAFTLYKITTQYLKKGIKRTVIIGHELTAIDDYGLGVFYNLFKKGGSVGMIGINHEILKSFKKVLGNKYSPYLKRFASVKVAKNGLLEVPPLSNAEEDIFWPF